MEKRHLYLATGLLLVATSILQLYTMLEAPRPAAPPAARQPPGHQATGPSTGRAPGAAAPPPAWWGGPPAASPRPAVVVVADPMYAHYTVNVSLPEGWAMVPAAGDPVYMVERAARLGPAVIVVLSDAVNASELDRLARTTGAAIVATAHGESVDNYTRVYLVSLEAPTEVHDRAAGVIEDLLGVKDARVCPGPGYEGLAVHPAWCLPRIDEFKPGSILAVEVPPGSRLPPPRNVSGALLVYYRLDPCNATRLDRAALVRDALRLAEALADGTRPPAYGETGVLPTSPGTRRCWVLKLRLKGSEIARVVETG